MCGDIMNLQPLERFQKLENKFKLTKLESKRPNSYVGVGETREGSFKLFEYPATDKLPAAAGIFVGSLRTSPIVKVVDFGENHTIFETEGGVYKLEKLEELRGY